MELAARASVGRYGDEMSGQGKQMPGLVARDPTSGPQGGHGGATSGSETGVEAQPPEVLRPPATTADADRFDAWLQAELSRLYDAALAEPVPEDIIRLLHQAARKS
jgi:hypothetical protein